VRQLANVLERSAILAEGQAIDGDDLASLRPHR
jgi:DNA-binding NtrC family response regulator